MWFNAKSTDEQQPVIDMAPECLRFFCEKRGQLLKAPAVRVLVGSLNGVPLSFFSILTLYWNIELDEVQIASLLDIALMKLIAISQRGKKRDFVDLYFI